MPSSSPSSSDSSSRRRVTFMDSDIVVPLPPSEVVIDTERPATAPPSHSSTSTMSSPSASGSYTPSSNSDSLMPATPILSDAVALPEVKVIDTCEPPSVILHPRLTISEPVDWNMLIDPQSPPQSHVLKQFGHDPMTFDGFPDSISKIQINCDTLPWPIIIDIEQDGIDRSPRVEDVSNSIYVSLQKFASSADLSRQNKERQRRIHKAYQRRCRKLSIARETEGLKRIDFLEGHTIFLGLSPGECDDEWHLHVGQPEE